MPNPSFAFFSALWKRCPPLRIANVTHGRLSMVLAAWIFALGSVSFAQDNSPVKRVLVPPGAKINDLIKGEGSLIEIPLATLEQKLLRLKSRKVTEVPRLVKSTYRAELLGNTLVSGGGQWLLHHAGPDPDVMPLPSFNLAVSRARLEGQDAILGDIDGQNLGLWIEKPGLQSLIFDWSLRGQPGVHGITFDAQLPACPLCIFEVKIPSDQAVAIPKGLGLLSGPHDTELPTWKLWRIQVAGKARLELTVRRGSDPGHPPLLFVSRDTRVQLTPELTLFDHEFQIEVAQSPTRELVVELDPRLRPFDVSSRQGSIERWAVEGPAGGATRPRLRIQLREPILGSLSGLRVRSTAPRWSDHVSELPTVSVVGAVHRGESLKLHVHPDQQLENWDAGAFRIVQVATESDGGQLVTLIDTHPDGKGRTPRFLVRSLGVDFTVSQDATWRLGPSDSTLTTELQYDISRGQLFELQARLPKGDWQVTAVETLPREALQKWVVAAGILHVDLQRGVTPRTTFKLKVQLQSDTNRASVKPRLVDIPDLEPLGAAIRQGSLAIANDGFLQLSLVQSNHAVSRLAHAPAADPRIAYSFVYRQTPVMGKVRLTPRRPTLHVESHQRVTLTPDGAQILAVLTLQPLAGQPAFVDLMITGAESHAQDRLWKFELQGAELRSKERLRAHDMVSYIAGLASPWSTVFIQGLNRDGHCQHWRLHFREPLVKAATLTVQQSHRMPRDLNADMPPSLLAADYGLALSVVGALRRFEQHWDVPVVVVPDAERFDGDLLIQPVDVSLTATEGRGMETGPVPGTQTDALPRYFRLKEGAAEAATLKVRTLRRRGGETSQAFLEFATLTTTLDGQDRARHHLRMVVWNWRALEFRVVLSADCQLMAARRDGIDFDRVARSPVADGIEVLLPMSGEAGPQYLELVFTGAESSWFGPLGRRVWAPMPRLPLTPLTVRRSLEMPPRWLPARQEEWDSVEQRAPLHETMQKWWTMGRDLVETVYPTPAPKWLAPQRLALLDAERGMRAGLGVHATFAEALSRLLLDTKGNAVPLVLDRAALAKAGLTPRSPLGSRADSPFWERVGLVFVTTPHGCLLTRNEYAHRWGHDKVNEQGLLFDGEVANATRQAVIFGQDSSGRFVAADRWLRTEPETGPGSISSAMASFHACSPSLNPGESLSRWYRVAGWPDRDYVDIVQPDLARWVGLLFGFVVAVVGLLVRGWIARATYFRVAWLTVALVALGIFAIPFSLRELLLGPLFAATALLALAYVRPSRKRVPTTYPPRRSKSTQKVVRALMTRCLLFGSLVFVIPPLFGQSDMRPTVYLLGDAGNKPPERVLVRPETLRWLDEPNAANKCADTVVLSAHFTGKIEGDAAVFQGEFDVHSFHERAMLELPLGGVDLREGSLLDGTPVFPVVLDGGKAGYRVPITGRGAHRLTLSFQSRLQDTEEVKFSIPSTPRTRLTWTHPARLGVPLVVHGIGEEKLQRDSRNNTVLDAQLGRETHFHLQWSSGQKSDRDTGLNVRELYSWDLRASSRAATAVLSYSGAAEVRSIQMQLPSTLSVRAVEPIESVSDRAPLLKSWRVTGSNPRVLQVDFLRPINGRFQLLIGLVPSWPVKDGVVELKLPVPVGAASSGGLLGVRLDESDSTEKARFLGIAGVAPELFVKEWGRATNRELSAPLRAYSFARATKNAAAAAIDVTPITAKPRLRALFEWTVQAQALDLVARLNLTGTDDLCIATLGLPAGFVLCDIRSADVHHWSREGDTVQVWMSSPRKQAVLEVLGFIRHNYPKSRSVSLPLIHTPFADVDETTLTLRSATGIDLEPKSMSGLALAAGSKLPSNAGDDVSLTVTPAKYRGEFTLKPRSAPWRIQGLTVAEVHRNLCSFSVQLHGRREVGEAGDLVVRLTEAPPFAKTLPLEPRLTLDVPNSKTTHTFDGKTHRWSIAFPPGTPQQIGLTIKSTMAMAPGVNVRLPELAIERGGIGGESLLALVGADLANVDRKSLVAVRMPGKEAAPWSLELGRLRPHDVLWFRRPTPVVGVASNVLVSGGTIRPRNAAMVQSVEALNAHHRVSHDGGEGWLHEMTWDLINRATHELEVALPPQAEFAAAFVQGQAASPRPSGPRSLSLSVPASAEPTQLRLLWRYPRRLEPLSQPRLENATLSGLDAIPGMGVLFLPAGWRTDPSFIDLTTAEFLLETASTSELALGRRLGDAGASASGIAANVQSLTALLRHADYQVRVARQLPEFKAIADLRWEPMLLRLNEDFRGQTKRAGLEKLRTAAAKQPWQAGPFLAGDFEETGLPRHWRSANGASTPIVQLVPIPFRPEHSPDRPILIGLLGVAVVLVLSFWPVGLAVWLRLWPEQLALLASFGLWWGGFSLVGAGVLSIAIGSRLYVGGRWMWRILSDWWTPLPTPIVSGDRG